MGVPDRLRYARQRAHLTGAQVEGRTRIGKSSLCYFENGKREPSLSQLQKLASVYHRSISFFLAEGPIPAELVLWRERPKGEAGDMEASFLRLCEQYYNLEVWTDNVIPSRLPAANGLPTDYGFRDAEALAKQVRDQLEMGDRPGLSLLAVLEEVCGVKVFHMDFEPSGTAACAKSDTFGAAVLLNARNRRWRRNFDLAHEFFHLLTWDVFRVAPEGQVPSSCPSGPEEQFANAFASDLLMPSDAVREAINRKVTKGRLTFADVFDVARQFDVSVVALLWRMQNLRLLSGDRCETQKLVDRAKLDPMMRERLGERRDRKPCRWPERYEALAVEALRRGEVSTGRFAEYLGITRQEAMRYVEREVTDDEEIPLAPA